MNSRFSRVILSATKLINLLINFIRLLFNRLMLIYFSYFLLKILIYIFMLKYCLIHKWCMLGASCTVRHARCVRLGSVRPMSMFGIPQRAVRCWCLLNTDDSLFTSGWQWHQAVILQPSVVIGTFYIQLLWATEDRIITNWRLNVESGAINIILCWIA